MIYDSLWSLYKHGSPGWGGRDVPEWPTRYIVPGPKTGQKIAVHPSSLTEGHHGTTTPLLYNTATLLKQNAANKSLVQPTNFLKNSQPKFRNAATAF